MKSQMKLMNRTSRGLWVAFFGPDGVGKSTVIEQLQQQLRPAFDEIGKFHFRPGFGRRALDRIAVTDPHANLPRSALISLGKLLYWLLDCWIGYVLTVFPQRHRCGLVIYDRYYPDILVDPVRYRLPPRTARIAKGLAKLAPRPDLCVLLDAPAEVVYARKSELPLAELRRQRVTYLKMFEGMPSKLLVNANLPINEVARNVAVVICSFFTNSIHEARESSLLADL